MYINLFIFLAESANVPKDINPDCVEHYLEKLNLSVKNRYVINAIYYIFNLCLYICIYFIVTFIISDLRIQNYHNHIRKLLIFTIHIMYVSIFFLQF